MIIRFSKDLDNLEVLCDDFDNGERNFLSFYMAEHLKRILSDGSFSAKITGLVHFPSSKFDEDPKNIVFYSRVTGFAVWNGGARESSYGTFTSRFVGGENGPIEYLKFSKWWNQVVLRRSGKEVQFGDSPPPLTNNPKIKPYFEREALTRSELIHLVRDNYAAHQPTELPDVLKLMDGPWEIGADIQVVLEDGTILSVMDGTLNWKVGQLAAAIRQVAEETLMAFGRRSNEHFLPKK